VHGYIGVERVLVRGEGLKSGRFGGIAIDVYEQEANLFFKDLSSTVIPDDVIQRLVSFPNVILTGHQAFCTREPLIISRALAKIAGLNASRYRFGQVPNRPWRSIDNVPAPLNVQSVAGEG
jgi:lactate dehydrogenase-like 2-hydroxyacid dehydrogenase